MSVVAFLRRLLSAGIDLDTAMTAAEAFEAEAPMHVPPRTKAAERQARWRERNKASQSVTRDESVTGETVETQKKSLPAPSKEKLHPLSTKPTASTREARSRRCPADWMPAPSVLAIAKAAGFNPGEIERELANIRDFEFSRPYADWDAVARRWFRRQETPRHERNNHPQRPERITGLAGIVARNRSQVLDRGNAERVSPGGDPVWGDGG